MMLGSMRMAASQLSACGASSWWGLSWTLATMTLQCWLAALTRSALPAMAGVKLWMAVPVAQATLLILPPGQPGHAWSDHIPCELLWSK